MLKAQQRFVRESRVSSIIVELIRPGSRAARLNEKYSLMLR